MSLRIYGVLVVLLVAILLLYTLWPKPVQALTQEQAKQFVLQDLSSLQAESRIVSGGPQPDGSGQFDVLVTQNPHSACPTVERRLYKLPPVSFRPSPFISECYKRNKLLYREEALINSAKELGIGEGYGCAFKASANFTQESAYCPRIDATALSTFTAGLPQDAWVAYWEANGGNRIIALGEDGTVLKQL